MKKKYFSLTARRQPAFSFAIVILIPLLTHTAVDKREKTSFQYLEQYVTNKVSVSEYIIRFRMQRAKELIDSGKSARILDLARQVGYSDPFYFSKSFKKQFGISPSQYLDSKKENRHE